MKPTALYPRFSVLVLVAITTLFSSSTFGGICNWLGQANPEPPPEFLPGSWCTPANWACGHVPNWEDMAIVNGPTAWMTCLGASCDGLFLGYNPGDQGRVEMSTGTLEPGYVVVGESGTGVFQQTGGMTMIEAGLSLGANPTGNGTYRLIGPGQLFANIEAIGNLGKGKFEQSNGIHSIAHALGVGTFPFGKGGTYELSGIGQLFANIEGIGNFCKGDFIQTGGINSIANSLGVGVGTGVTGTYHLSGTGILLSPREGIGDFGIGQFTQTGGINSVSNVFAVGVNPDASGTYNLSDTGELLGAVEFVGYQGSGQFVQTGGTNETDKLRIAWYAESFGRYYLQGGELEAEEIEIGEGDGQFVFAGGTLHAETLGTDAKKLNLTNEGGVLAPGGSVGSTRVFGDYQQLANATLEIELGGVGADQLVVTGDVGLKGTLTVQAIGGLGNPGDKGSTIVCTEAGTITGEFDDKPAADDYLGYGVFYRSDAKTAHAYNVTVFQAMAGDADGDGDVDPTDLSKLVQNWAPAGMDKIWPEGNFDDHEDGNVDPSDLSVLVQNWAPAGYLPEGAPPMGSATAVPEPGTLVLLAIGVTALLLFWRRSRAA